MADWLSSMQQSFEYYVVDPVTWKDVRQVRTITSCTINRDLMAETLGSASINIDETLGECYLRVYLVVIQNGVKERHPVGTFLVQTSPMSFDGKIKTFALDAYTPLLELKEKLMPLGYSVLKNQEENVMDLVHRLTRENMRAPVVEAFSDVKVEDDFVANPDDNWLSFLSDLAAKAKYSYDLDEVGRVLFTPSQITDAMQPVWTYDDNNSSILLPELNLDMDLYGIPNKVEVIYTNADRTYRSVAVNDDPESQTSTVNRGREIVYRDTEPSLYGLLRVDQEEAQRLVDEYAEEQLKSLSTIEYTVTYTHGYCPVRINDCVRLNYKRAGLDNVKARVIRQSIKCEPGCQVTETAVFTKKLWR